MTPGTTKSAGKQSDSDAEKMHRGGSRLTRVEQPPSAEGLLAFQQAAGNLAIQRLLDAGTVQPKLHIGNPDDPLETDADQVADRVVRMKTAPCGGVCPDYRSGRDNSVPRKIRPQDSSRDRTVSRSFLQDLGSGRLLDSPTRDFFEPRFGRDFSQVRVHTDRLAASAAHELEARAFTQGHDIYFGEGRYQPGTSEGQRLLAHELTHTVQQKADGPSTLSEHHRCARAVLPTHDPLETEAENAANLVAIGSSIPGGIIPTTANGTDRGVIARQGTGGSESKVKPDQSSDFAKTDAEQPGASALRIKVSMAEPALVYVPGTAKRSVIAGELFGDEALTEAFDFVPTAPFEDIDGVAARAVRVRKMEQLKETPLAALRRALDEALAKDVAWTVGKLSEGFIGPDDESNLTERALRWSQRSDIPTPDGTSYFDAYLSELAATTLAQPHWYTLTITQTKRNALEWLLIETEEKSEQIKKAIALRSKVHTTGYRVTDRRPQLKPPDVVGRFYWSSGSGIQIRVRATLAIETTLQKAISSTRQKTISGTGLAISIVVPGGDGFYYGYRVGYPPMDPGVKDPLDDPRGHYFWYHPGTIFISEHHIWEEATREQFSADISKQSQDIRKDLLGIESMANRVRTDAAGGGLPQNVFKTWVEADRTILLLGTSVQGGTVESDLRRQLEERLKAFYDAFRTEVATLDDQRTTSRMYGERWSYTTNPYLTAVQRDTLVTRLKNTQSFEHDQSTSRWRGVLRDYRYVLAQMDRFIIDSLKRRGRKEQAEQLEFAGAAARELDETLAKHPNAQRIRAVFYSQDQLQKEGPPDNPRISAIGIPLLFYAYRDGTTWFLKDITTPKKVKVNSEAGGTKTSPPVTLFEELNSRLRFPRGQLYWEMPDGTIYRMRTTEPWSYSDWLTWIGIGLAVVGLTLASGGMATPATVLIIGSGVAGAVGAGLDIYEKSQLGVLTQKDVFINVVAIIGSLAGAASTGMGRIVATGAGKTGTAAKIAVFADRYYLPAVGINIAADAVTLITLVDTAWEQYKAIQRMSDEKARDLALTRLVSQLLITGGMTLMAVKGDVASFRQGRQLFLDPDFADAPMARPLLSQSELNSKLSGLANPEALKALLARSDLDNNLRLRIRADLADAALAGKIPTESLQGIISKMKKAKTATAVREVLAELRYANRLVHTRAVSQHSKIIVNAKAGTEYELTPGRREKIDPVPQTDAFYVGADGKLHLDEVKNTPIALREKLAKKPQQLERMKEWKADDPHHRVINVAVESESGWTELFGKKPRERRAALRALIDEGVPLSIGRYTGPDTLTPTKLKEIWDAVFVKHQAQKKALGTSFSEAGFYEQMSTLEKTAKFLNISIP